MNKIKKPSLDFDKDQLANNILELTIIDDRNLIEAAIRFYNHLCIKKQIVVSVLYISISPIVQYYFLYCLKKVSLSVFQYIKSD